MKVLLLVAGRSRRFWPLSEKSLFPICGKPLIGHQIARLREAGLSDITIVGGKHNLDLIKELFPDVPAIEQENLDLGMQGALLSALPSVGEEPVMVVSANDVIESSAYEDLQKAAKGKDTHGVILARKVEAYFPGGYLSVDASGRITGIVEKPGAGHEPSDLVNIVAHIHKSPQVLHSELLKAQSDKDDGYEKALATVFHTHVYKSVPYTGDWQAVKFSWHLLHLLPLLLKDTEKKIHKTATVHPTAVIEGDVVLEEGVRVLPHATIVGPCYVGRGTIIGNNALVRGSSIGNHCVIGYATEVKGSVLANHVWAHSSYLGDSVIGENVSFGASCITGNFRLDEGEIHSGWYDSDPIPTGLTKFGAIIGQNSRLGIQVGINPGIKIGEGSFIVGGAMVMQDIPEKSFVSVKDGKLEVKPNKAEAPRPEERERYRPR